MSDSISLATLDALVKHMKEPQPEQQRVLYMSRWEIQYWEHDYGLGENLLDYFGVWGIILNEPGCHCWYWNKGERVET